MARSTLKRLSGRKACDYVLRRGSKWKGKTFNASWLPGPPRLHAGKTGLYVGTFASVKLHKSAVARNRMRRRIREALRITVKNMADVTSAHLLLIPRSSSRDAPVDDVVRDMRSFLLALPPWHTQKNPRPAS